MWKKVGDTQDPPQKKTAKQTHSCISHIYTATRKEKHANIRSIDTLVTNVISIRLIYAWTAIDRLSIIWKSDLTNKSFFQAAVVSILLYGCTTWKYWQQHLTRYQLYGHLPPITKTIQVRRTRHVGHCWRSRDELICDVLLWIPTYGRAKAVRPARTYIQQLCEDTGCSPENLPEAMNNREKWRERVSVIVPVARNDDDDGIYIYIYIYIHILRKRQGYEGLYMYISNWVFHC